MKLLLTAILFLSACDSPLRHMTPEKPFEKDSVELINFNDSLNAEVTWTAGPYGNPDVFSGLEIKFLDENLNPIAISSGDQLFIQASMGMDHGIASAGEFYTDDLTLWRNDKVAFYMGGNYTITLYIFDENFNELGSAEWSVLF